VKENTNILENELNQLKKYLKEYKMKIEILNEEIG